MLGKRLRYKATVIAIAVAMLGLGLLFANQSITYAGFIDQKGKLIIKLAPDAEAGEFHDGLAPLKQGNSWGYIDKSGRWMIPPQFGKAHNFSQGLAAVYISSKKKFAFINRQAQGVLELDATTVGDFHDGIAMVVNGDKCGYIDVNGTFVIPQDYTYVSPRHSSLQVVPVAQPSPMRWCYVDHSNKPVLQKSFLDAKEVTNGLAPVLLKYRTDSVPTWGYLGTSGKGFAIEPQYADAEPFYDGYAKVAVSGNLNENKALRFTFIDAENKRLPVDFDKANSFSEGLAACGNLEKSTGSNKFGYIDKSGKFIIAPRFDEAEKFSEGLAFTKRKQARQFWQAY